MLKIVCNRFIRKVEHIYNLEALEMSNMNTVGFKGYATPWKKHGGCFKALCNEHLGSLRRFNGFEWDSPAEESPPTTALMREDEVKKKFCTVLGLDRVFGVFLVLTTRTGSRSSGLIKGFTALDSWRSVRCMLAGAVQAFRSTRSM